MNKTNVEQNKNKISSIIGFLVYIAVIVTMSLCYFLIPVSSLTECKLDVFCSNCTIDNANEFHGKYLSNESVSITFKADLRCALPSDVNVMIGDKPLAKDSDYAYSADTGEMSIKLKGDTNVSIDAVCNVLSFDVTVPAHSSFDVGFDYSKEPILNENTYPSIVDWGDGTKDNKSSHHFDEQDEEKNYTISIYDYSYDYFSFSNLSSKDYIKTIFIPTSVSQIKERSFANFTGLSSIEFASDSKLTSISGFAFLRCDSLSSVTLPKGLTSISEYAFSSCTSLKTITIPSSVTSIGGSAFANCSKMEEITFEKDSQLTTIDKYAFSNSSLPSITIPNGVTSIGEGAFSECEQLTSVIIPNSVTTISDFAFFACSSLSSVTIPKSVVNMGSLAMCIGEESITPYIFCEIAMMPQTWNNDWTRVASVVYWAAVDVGANDEYSYVIQNFDGNQTISLMTYIGESDPVDIVIPSTIDVNGTSIPVSGIGDNIFKNCSTLTSVSIPNSITTIGANAFNKCINLTTVTLEEGVRLTSVGDYAFEGDDRITNKPVVVISENMTYIGDSAFRSYGFQFTLEEGSQLTYIGDYALDYATFTSPASFVFSDSLTSIGECAFRSNKNLVSVTIPSSVTSIGASAFQACSDLEEVIFDEDIQLSSINDGVFSSDSKLTSIAIPSSVTSFGNNAFYSSGLTSITIPNSVTSIGRYAFSNCKQLGEVIFEPGIQLTSIDEYVFSSDSKLTSITIPNTVTSIGRYAFSSSGLTSITIPNSVTSIGERAFASCSSLAEVIFEDGGSQLATIGKSAFYGDKKLISITLPTGITSIGDSVFYNTGLTSLTIPNYITSIDYGAYGSCTSLTTVTYETNSQLETIGESAFLGCSSLSSISIPNSVTSIGYDAFYRINASAVIDITELDHVITLDYELLNSNFAGTIKVSKAMENDYKNAPVWRNYSNFIVGVE